MSLTALSAPEATESVVTITLHITLNGDLPPAAARLISDLENFANSQRPAPLRLVEPAALHAGPEEGRDPRVRRIGRGGENGPSLYLRTGPRLVLHHGVAVRFTRREYDLFQFFCENPRRVFTRAQLLRQVWGHASVNTERTVDVHVRRLRAKLTDCASIITTVRGVGYRFDDDTPVEVVVRED